VTTLSTHVLDTERGTPAAGLAVSLFHAGQLIAHAQTNADGRIPNLGEAPLRADTYRLVFDVAAYYAIQGRAAPFFQRVTLEFRVGAEDRHLHVPLLLSPYGCTTYRGS
jgi:5-hydroxyisourate hydrolase